MLGTFGGSWSEVYSPKVAEDNPLELEGLLMSRRIRMGEQWVGQKEYKGPCALALVWC